MNRKSLRNVMSLVLVSLIIACASYVVNLWLFASHPRVSPQEASFLEGIISIALGLLLLVGSGGITHGTRRAAFLAAAAGAMSSETVGPSEVYRRDAWKPKGFVRAGLVFIIAGAFLLVIYFLAPWIIPLELSWTLLIFQGSKG